MIGLHPGEGPRRSGEPDILPPATDSRPLRLSLVHRVRLGRKHQIRVAGQRTLLYVEFRISGTTRRTIICPRSVAYSWLQNARRVLRIQTSFKDPPTIMQLAVTLPAKWMSGSHIYSKATLALAVIKTEIESGTAPCYCATLSTNSRSNVHW